MLTSAVLLLAGAAQAQQAPGETIASQRVLVERIHKRFAEAQLGEKVALSVVNLASGREIVTERSNLALNPASNMKLVTAAAALSQLGADFRMRTGLYGRLQGDGVVGGLYLKGHADPTLSAEALLELGRQLQARGVRKVDEVVVDGSYFDGQILPPAFEQQPNEVSPFRAPIAAVSVDRNAYTLQVRPGSAVGEPAKVSVGAVGYFDIENRITTSEAGAPNVIAIQRGDAEQLSLRLRGKVPVGSGMLRYRRRVRSPLHHAGFALVEALRSLRIQVPRRVRIAPTPAAVSLLAHRSSPPLSQMLLAMGKRSDNFTAETVLKVLGAEVRRRPGRSADGVEVALQMLKRMSVPISKLSMVNGSGLFDGNRLAPAHLTRLLAAVYADESLRPEYLAHLAVGGVDGTLARRMRELPAPRVVRAKTGTLASTIALSGYVLGPSPGRVMAVSFIANGVRGKHHAARLLIDDVCLLIAQHLHSSRPAGRDE